jgi:uncharacterized protein (TIGR02117 family)
MLIAILTFGYLSPQPGLPHVGKGCQVLVCAVSTGLHSNILVPEVSPGFNWHTVLPIQEWLTESSHASNDYRYLSFGWGERVFYRLSPTRIDQILRLGWRALFLPNTAILKVQGYRQIPHHLPLQCTQVSKPEYQKLVKYIQSAFEQDAEGRWMQAGDEPLQRSHFYLAKGTYSILNNSNNWTAQGLRLAGIRTPRWSSLASAVLYQFHHPCDQQQSG